MARTSKRKIRMEGREVVPVIDKIYSVAIYARLSVDNRDGKEVSIETQIAIAKECMKNHADMRLFDTYVDLGATGTNFERHGFERMMQDIRDEKVNCVIVKDLSRFGRNHIETANYLQKIFPFMGVRFIAVTDQYDSLQPAEPNRILTVDIKNIVNELYAKEVSQKAALSKKLRMEKGEFIGSIAPYGYRIEMVDGKRSLRPEDQTCDVVKIVFELFSAGNSLIFIRDYLFENKIHRPSDYRKYEAVYCSEGQELHQWGRDTLVWILTNEAYVGKLTQTTKGLDEPITVNHTHEPLILEDVYYRVQSKLIKNSERNNRNKIVEEVQEDIFRDILYCGECGHKLVRKTSMKKRKSDAHIAIFYGCPYMSRIDSQKCTTQHISFDEITFCILETLKKEFALSSVQMKQLTKYNDELAAKRKHNHQQKCAELQNRIKNYDVQASINYLSYRKGQTTIETLQVQRAELMLNKSQDEEKLAELQNTLKGFDKTVKVQNQVIRAIVKCRQIEDLSTELINILVKRINVYAQKRMEIIWNFDKEILLEAEDINNEK